jgi:hypothetical protein
MLKCETSKYREVKKVAKALQVAKCNVKLRNNNNKF